MNLSIKLSYLSRLEAEKIVKNLVAEGKISLSGHCKVRMQEREITMQQIINCLAKGIIIDEPFLTFENGGGYEITMERKVAGIKLRVAACLRHSQKVLVITAIKI